MRRSRKVRHLEICLERVPLIGKSFVRIASRHMPIQRYLA